LSGGERKRLYLCTVLIQNPNFLILDEPTNDLDIVTLNVLESFLLDFSGCVIVVLHDRYFMDIVVARLFVVNVEGEIEDFLGHYTDYRIYEDSQPAISNTSEEKKYKKAWKKSEDNKLTYNEEKELKNIESKLNSLAFDKKELESKFNNPDLSPEKINKLDRKSTRLNS